MMLTIRPNGSRATAIGLVAISMIALGVLLVPAKPAAAVTYSITVYTDKASYSGNETIIVAGVVSPAPGANTGTVITIKDPGGNPVDIASVPVNATSGAYNHDTIAGGTSNWTNGNYSVTASWGGNGVAIVGTAFFNYSQTASTTTTTTTTTTPTKTPTTTTITCTSTSVDVGATTSCTAKLSGFKAPVAGEKITWSQTGGACIINDIGFCAGQVYLFTCPLNSGGACFVVVEGVSAGSATVKASYPGDTNNLASSGTASLTVNQVTTTTTTTTTTSSTVPEFSGTSLLLVTIVALSAVAALAKTGPSRPGHSERIAAERNQRSGGNPYAPVTLLNSLTSITTPAQSISSLDFSARACNRNNPRDSCLAALPHWQ